MATKSFARKNVYSLFTKQFEQKLASVVSFEVLAFLENMSPFWGLLEAKSPFFQNSQILKKIAHMRQICFGFRFLTKSRMKNPRPGLESPRPIFFKTLCRQHRRNFYGRNFCQKLCVRIFFWPKPTPWACGPQKFLRCCRIEKKNLQFCRP